MSTAFTRVASRCFVPPTMRVREEARPVIATVDPADIRGLVTTLLTFVGRLPRSRHEGRPKPPHNAAEGCAKPRPRLLPDPAELSVCSSDSDRHLSRDRPEEREDLARDGRDNDIRVLPACDHAAVPLAQPHLRLPRDFLNRLRALFDPLLQVSRHLRRIAIGPGRFHQRPTRVTVAGLGDRAETARLARRVLARDPANERGELPGAVEAGDVSK